MKNHTVKVYPSRKKLSREEQLAWKIAAVATDPVELEDDVADMAINRIIDNASVAMASVNRTQQTPEQEWRSRQDRADAPLWLPARQNRQQPDLETDAAALHR